ncbi:hypothetical protein DL1_08500 [Thioclava dalianensis]|uniref:Uncharacterized protein n=1 Tax=Thioclava dalianensis TaxID=1185766 RepID=A0A074TF99_9RHOB|nr:hypothetical protein DL1_08500 [Thioclava dalianensis]
MLVLKAKIEDEVKIGDATVTVERDQLVIRLPPEAGFRMGDSVFQANRVNGYMRFLIDAPSQIPVRHTKRTDLNT